MTSILKITAMACVLAAVTSVFAVPAPVILEIKGKIKPGTCTPMFISSEEIIDYGTTLPSKLDHSHIGKRGAVKISCGNHQQMVGYYITDINADTLPGTADVNSILNFDNISFLKNSMGEVSLDGVAVINFVYL